MNRRKLLKTLAVIPVAAAAKKLPEPDYHTERFTAFVKPDWRKDYVPGVNSRGLKCWKPKSGFGLAPLKREGGTYLYDGTYKDLD